MRRRLSHLMERNHDATSVDVHFRALLWIQGQRDPTPEGLSQFMGCSRATAYRYLAAWRRVTGQPAAPHGGSGGKAVSQPPRAREAYSPSPDHPWNRRHVP